MENRIYNDDVERIVNDPERQNLIKQRNIKRKIAKQKRMLVQSVLFASIGLVCGLFGCFGWLAPLIAIFAGNMFGIYSAFCFGRWFSMGNYRWCNLWQKMN